MSWETVEAAPRWWTPAVGTSWGGLPDRSSNEFTSANKTTITNYLKALYFSTSDTARGILEDAALLNGGQIRIYQTSSVPGFAPFLGTTPTGAIGPDLGANW
jgi:hypothetical protein